MGMEQLDDIKEHTDIVINTTSLGMLRMWKTARWIQHLQTGTIISDLIYNPRMTRWLVKLQNMGVKYTAGLVCLFIRAHTPTNIGRARGTGERDAETVEQALK